MPSSGSPARRMQRSDRMHEGPPAPPETEQRLSQFRDRQGSACGVEDNDVRRVPSAEEASKKVRERAKTEVDLTDGKWTFDEILKRCEGDIRRIKSGDFKLSPGSV